MLWLLMQDKESVYEVVKAVDKASGYIFGEGDDATMAMMSSAMGADFDFFKYPCLWLACWEVWVQYLLQHYGFP